MTDAELAMIGDFAAAFGRVSRAATARQEVAETQAEADRARRHAALWADVCAGLLELPGDIAREEAEAMNDSGEA